MPRNDVYGNLLSPYTSKCIRHEATEYNYRALL